MILNRFVNFDFRLTRGALSPLGFPHSTEFPRA